MLGARNLGGAIAAHLAEQGWQVAAVSRTDESLAGVRERGLTGLTADASDPESLAAALGEAAGTFGRLDLVVNAVAAARPASGPFGGGPLAEATLDGFEGVDRGRRAPGVRVPVRGRAGAARRRRATARSYR